MSYINNSFSLNENYYFSNFLDQLATKRTYSEVLSHVIDNFTKVCAFYGPNNVVIKQTKNNPFEIITTKDLDESCGTRINIVEEKPSVKKGEIVYETIKIKSPKISILALTEAGIRTFMDINYYPFEQHGYFWASRPFAGSQEVSGYSEEKLEPIFNYLRRIYNFNEELFQYHLDLEAWQIQNPSEKSGVVTLWRSGNGYGKSSYTDWKCKYVYGDYVSVPNGQLSSINAEFNSEFAYKSFYVFEEANSIGNQFYVNFEKFKGMVTSETEGLRKMRKEKKFIKSFCNYHVNLNPRFSVAIDNRRWFCNEILPENKAEDSYYREFIPYYFKTHGAQYGSWYFRFLKERKVTRDIRAVPDTPYRQYLLGMVVPKTVKFIKEKLLNNPDIFRKSIEHHFEPIKYKGKFYDFITTKKEIRNQYKLWCVDNEFKFNPKEVEDLYPLELLYKGHYYKEDGKRSTIEFFDIKELTVNWKKNHLLKKDLEDDDDE